MNNLDVLAHLLAQTQQWGMPNDSVYYSISLYPAFTVFRFAKTEIMPCDKAPWC